MCSERRVCWAPRSGLTHIDSDCVHENWTRYPELRKGSGGWDEQESIKVWDAVCELDSLVLSLVPLVTITISYRAPKWL